MSIQPYIDLDLVPLAPSDTVGHAVYRFADLDVKHLPVVDEEGSLLALVSEEELLKLATPSVQLSAVAGLGAVSARADAHVFEMANLLVIHRLSVLPVVEDGVYIGVVRRRSVFEVFAKMLATGTPGTVLELDIPTRDYSLTQLSHLIEQSGGRVLSSSAQMPLDVAAEPSFVRVTLKLNVSDTSRIRYLLEHNGYDVTSVFNEEESEDDLSLRVQEFMRYLEV
jgi:predicted transcriptional regulator